MAVSERAVSLWLGFRIPPELLKNAPSHHTFSGVEPKHASRDSTNQTERFDYSASQAGNGRSIGPPWD